ncbi:MAG: hypothetical protein ACRDMH_06690 [Solirubrobacterales bacterium]
MDERDELSRVGRRFGLDETEFADELQGRDWTPVQVEGRLSILLDLADRWKKEAETVDPPLQETYRLHARELQAELRRMLFRYPTGRSADAGF